MRLLENIYNKLSIVICNFSDADSYTLSYALSHKTKNGIRIKRTNSETESKEWSAKYPAVLVVCGYGVVAKSVIEGDETIAKITSEGGNFVWNYSSDGTMLYFARRSQVDKLTDALDDIKIFKYECCGAVQADDDTFLTEAISALYADTIKYRTLLKPASQNSVLALYLAKRIRMPLLVILFLLLLANVFIDKNIGDRATISRAQLTTMQNNRSRQNTSDNASRTARAEFDNALLDIRYAVVLDRIAAIVPTSITLTQLSVQPKLRAVENGKKPILSNNSIVIEGTAHSAEDVSSFVASLRNVDFIKEVTLASLSTARGSSQPQFRINARL